MERLTRLDLPLLLPEVDDLRDACIARLIALLERRPGVAQVHVIGASELRTKYHNDTFAHDTAIPDVVDKAQLCLHYDPERLTIAKVEEIARLAGAEIAERFGHVVLPFRAIGAPDEGRRLEQNLLALPGVAAASVNFAAQTARVEYDRTKVDAAVIRAALAESGAAPEGGTEPSLGEEAARPGWYRRNRELAWSLAAGALLLGGWLAARATSSRWPIGIFALSYAFGSWDNLRHLLKDLRKGRFRFNIDLLMIVAAIGAAILGHWVEGALLLFLFSIGHALEHYAMGRARNAIRALADLAPQRATVVREGGESVVGIEEVRAGDRVVVKPAERLPVDGLVLEGQSGVNQAPITGESVPVSKGRGDKVFAGSVNGEGSLVIEVTAALGDRTLDRVIKLVAEAETQKAPTQQFTDRFERVFVPIVLLADLVLIVAPPLWGLWTWSESFYRGMALLVAASPCALALGTPAAVLAGIAQAARRGVLIKGGAHLETLGTIDTLALDKTGTITKGEPAVTDVVTMDGVTEDELLSSAAAIEGRSQHPLARAVLAAATARSLQIPESGDVQSVTGRGIRSNVDGNMVEVGRLLMFEEGGEGIPDAIRETVTGLEKNGRTTVVVRAGGRWLGVLGIADEPREGAKATIERLRQLGIARIVMLTGDNAGVANAVAGAVGLSEVRAGLLPEDKVVAIRELASAGKVAMVGDGVNDAPALALATVGIAMGGAETAAALETADVALMGDDLGHLPFAIGLSRQARSIIRQNLFLSLTVIVTLILATITGMFGIGPTVIAHEGSTLLVVGNGLRLLAYKEAQSLPKGKRT